MHIDQALDFLYVSNVAPIGLHSGIIPPELIITLLGEEDVAKARRRRMPMEL